VDNVVSPESVRPFRKAGPRKGATNQRKKGKSAIFTDTPVKKQREDEERNKLESQGSRAKAIKLSAQSSPKRSKKMLTFRSQNHSQKSRPISNRPNGHARSGSAVLCNNPEDSDDDLNHPTDDERRKEAAECDALFERNLEIECGNYVLVEFAGKRSKTYYVGRVHAVEGDEIKTRFLRRSDLHKGASMSFSYPAVGEGDETSSSHEIASHECSAIVMKLPYPSYAGGTKRCASKHVFPCDLSVYDPL